MLDNTSSSETPRKRNFLSLTDRIAIHDLLKEVAAKEGDFVVFKPGWDDHAIAQKLGVTAANVQSVRLSTLGLTRAFRKTAAPKIKSATSQKIAELEQRISYLEDQLGLRRH